MYGITLLKVLVVAQSHGGIAVTPPPAPVPAVTQAPAVIAAPAPTPAPAPVVTSTPAPAIVQQPAVVPATTTTTTSTTVPPVTSTDLSGLECVITVPNGPTYSPGPADTSGGCSAYADQVPTGATITPTQETGTEYTQP
jgi:hypothetical protein